MKPIIQLTIALLAVLTLSACGLNNSTQNQNPNEPNKTTSTTTLKNEGDADKQFTSFLPFSAEFHMGPIIPEQGTEGSMRFPVQTIDVKSVNVKLYKISQSSFNKLQEQQRPMAAHEDKLDISILSKNEQKPIFIGNKEIVETGPSAKEPPYKIGYIQLPTIQDKDLINRGYYYIEFESAETPDSTQLTTFHSLLEITETYRGYNEQYTGMTIPH